MESSVGARSDSCSSLGVVSTDGGSIDELSAKFSVQGTSSSKSSGKKKVVSFSTPSTFLCHLTIFPRNVQCILVSQQKKVVFKLFYL